ncbi:MAG: M55 family metallopeptidase [Candidatus Hodarchaeales archaeon]|jgi:D-amino peptidase
MKAFISLDLEGLPHVVLPGHLSLKGSLYSEARKIATQVALVTAEELHNNGFDEILLADSHGPMVNIYIDKLPSYVEIIRGFPRPTSMVAGIDGSDVALFLGYHSKFGTAHATFDHTYSGGTIHKLVINGNEVSEYLLNGFTAGEFGVPVILVAGDSQLLVDDVSKYSPNTEKVIFKQALSRTAAKSPSMQAIEETLKIAIQNAISSYKKKLISPLKMESPITSRVTFHASHFADAADLLPSITRIDGLTVEFQSKKMLDVYKTFEFLVLSSLGVSYLHTLLQ